MTQKIYAIQSEAGPIKIEFSAAPGYRLRQLLAQQPFLAEVIQTSDAPKGLARAVKAAAHQILSVQGRRGEWFDVSKDKAMAAIKSAIEVVEQGLSLGTLSALTDCYRADHHPHVQGRGSGD